jgi:uncharacterized membrane protein
MNENIGRMDRWLRVALGGGLVLAGLRGLGRSSLACGVLLTSGALLLETALTRVCPVNAALGLDTRKWDRSDALPAPADEAYFDVGALQRPPAES